MQIFWETVSSYLGLVTIVLVVFGYARFISALRKSVPPAEQPSAQAGTFSDSELTRYARHIMLREIGGPGQKRLKDAKVLVIGAGGLGAPVLLYLAASGVGVIGVVDEDVVEISNLQRQVIHSDAHLGMDKVHSAQIAMLAINPYIEVRPYKRRLTVQNAKALMEDYDLILDGSDNFDTRYLVNETAVTLQKPLISAAITQWEGQISLYDPARGGPCYCCIFPNAPTSELAPNCAAAGVAAPLPGVIGSMMAIEAVKALTLAGQTLRGRLFIYDALYAQSRTITLNLDVDCHVCHGAGQGVSPSMVHK
ncbi:MAG: HesA/MoeB/ThiF family protein [Paracoccaceae bacterium]|jgi:molybdopterin/thiamine biosynthesis adenylyltransferase